MGRTQKPLLKFSAQAGENSYGWIIHMEKLDYVDQVKAAFGL
jgi:hypothetical protein